MKDEKVSMITILNEKEFQIFRDKNRMEISFIDTILHPKLVDVLKECMIEKFGEVVYPIPGLSCLDNHFVKLRDLNTDLGISIFDYLSVGTGDIFLELEMSVYDIVSIEISKLFEINQLIKRTKNCSFEIQKIFKSNLFTDFTFPDSEIYSFLPDISFASCKSCLKIGDSWEKNYVLDLKERNNNVNLLNIF